MATYDNKVLTGDQLVYFSSLIKSALAEKVNVTDVPAVPSNTSDLNNDSGFQTAAQVQSAITSAMSGISSFSFEIVNSLPATGDASKIYLVAKSTSGTNQVYTEYIYVNSAWEIIGDTQMTIDTLSNQEVQTIWNTASAT